MLGPCLHTAANAARLPLAAALELLAVSRDGCTEAIMLAHGFSIEMMVEMIKAGLASAQAERTVAAGRARSR
jgi:hypothetical protein